MFADRATSLEQLLGDGWDYHDRESERLAGELEAAADQEIAAELLIPFLHLSTHVIGEHLDDWPRALRLGKRIVFGRTPAAETADAWARLYVAATLAGEGVEASNLELACLKAAEEDFGSTLLRLRFMLIAALVGSKRAGEAARLYRVAVNLAASRPESALLDRMIAVASNNLGWELYEMASRTADEQTLMLLCAETSLEFWPRCGSWINRQRAHYLASRTANVSGDPAAGLAHADAGLAIIADNGERPLDGAMLHLARAASLAALGDERGWMRAIEDADMSASKLTAPDLRAQFAVERAKTVGTGGSEV